MENFQQQKYKATILDLKNYHLVKSVFVQQFCFNLNVHMYISHR